MNRNQVYGRRYRKARLQVLGLPCWRCGRTSTTADHFPPLSDFPDPALWQGVLRPSCLDCMRWQAGQLGQRAKSRQSRRW